MTSQEFIKEKTFTHITSNCDNEFSQIDVILKKDAEEAVKIAKTELFNDIKNIIYQDTTLDVNIKEYVVHILKNKGNEYSKL